ncbi:MAG: ABC transporter permease [Nocardioides sp.]
MTALRTELTGTWVLVRLILRRDRVRIVVWIVSVTALVIVTALSVKGLFPTQAALDQAADASSKNAAAIAFNGPVQGLETVGGEVAFQTGTGGLVLVALMSLLMIVRCTRSEEETGRAELLRSTPLGRDAHTASALIVVTGMNVAIAVAVVLSLVSEGLPVIGSVAFGVSFLAIGLVFTALTLVTAQVTENSRVAGGVAGAVLGAAFVLRAVGDIGDGRLSWLSPIGWSQKSRPFAGEQWWPFLVPAVASIALLLVARVLTARRDLGAGLVRPRPGRAAAAPSLAWPIGLAVRLQRGTVAAWAVGLVVLGFAYGAITNDVSDFVGDNQTMKDLMAAAGGPSLIDAYLGTAMLILALTAAGFAVQSVQRLHSEEASTHAESLLATPLSRMRWMASHLAVALGGSALIMVAAGLGTGIPYAFEVGDAHQVPALVGAALVHIPAVWVVAGVAAALFGLAPRAISAAWAVLAICFVIGFLGEVLRLPRWVIDLSPFQHTPELPAAELTIAPIAILLATAAALIVIGIGSFHRRDLT